jgi:hypothetical protein
VYEKTKRRFLPHGYPCGKNRLLYYGYAHHKGNKKPHSYITIAMPACKMVAQIIAFVNPFSHISKENIPNFYIDLQ